VLKLLGVAVDKKTTCGKVLSFELTQLRLTWPRSFQVFLGEFAPIVYVYILPKSATSANVPELPSVAEQLRAGVVVREKSGWAPIRYFTAKWVYGNVVPVGDVANQNFKPFVEGIIPTIIWVVLRSEAVLAQALPLRQYPPSETTRSLELCG
jgi:hypothetical protein